MVTRDDDISGSELGLGQPHLAFQERLVRSLHMTRHGNKPYLDKSLNIKSPFLILYNFIQEHFKDVSGVSDA